MLCSPRALPTCMRLPAVYGCGHHELMPVFIFQTCGLSLHCCSFVFKSCGCGILKKHGLFPCQLQTSECLMVTLVKTWIVHCAWTPSDVGLAATTHCGKWVDVSVKNVGHCYNFPAEAAPSKCSAITSMKFEKKVPLPASNSI